jgi:hypothetical protein
MKHLYIFAFKICFVLLTVLPVKISNAAIIYTDVNPDAVKGSGESDFLDLDNDGQLDIYILQFYYSGLNYNAVISTGMSYNGGATYLGFIAEGVPGYAKRFAANDVISNANSFSNSTNASSMSSNFNSSGEEWDGVTDGYLGVQFLISGVIHYGWVRLDVASDGMGFTVKDYAYESNALTQILAGAGSIITGTISLSTTAVSLIDNISALSGGNITNDGGAVITTRGVCWSTSPNPTITGSKTLDGTSTGAYSSSLSGLSPNTTYYVRAYATNAMDTAYGNEGTFTTTDIPSLSTTAAPLINSSSAVSGGNITSDRGAAITARGVCWSTSPNPTITDSKTNDGIGTGSYSSFLTGLSPSTTYYVRAYATNAVGTAYGNEISFTTMAVTGITRNSAVNKTSIYPNPFSETAIIEIDEKMLADKCTFSMYDHLGNRVFQMELNAAQNNLSAKNLESGIYFYKVETEDEILGSGKIIVQ